METVRQPSQFWIIWLLIVSAGVAAFGLILVLLPETTRKAFSLLVYSSPTSIETFGTEQVRYISLTHAVLGGVMVGWGSVLFFVVKDLLAKKHSNGWNLVAVSLLAWFIPDTAYSLLSGYWQNAVLNAGFLILFAIPLWAIRRDRKNAA
jgi:hypothetical protein